jgi:hypothetical protein
VTRVLRHAASDGGRSRAAVSPRVRVPAQAGFGGRMTFYGSWKILQTGNTSRRVRPAAPFAHAPPPEARA